MKTRKPKEKNGHPIRFAVFDAITGRAAKAAKHQAKAMCDASVTRGGAVMTITNTPWGQPDHVEELGDSGVFLVCTPSHGGYFVPPEVNARVPASWRGVTWNKRGEAGWYEEDADWALLALALPELFIEEERAIARRIVAYTHEKKLYRGAFEGY